MAVGDTVGGVLKVAASSYIDLKPDPGVEWIIHNIYWNQSVQLYRLGAVGAVAFHEDAAKGALLGGVFHCTNGHWIRVINTVASEMIMGYDGVQKK